MMSQLEVHMVPPHNIIMHLYRLFFILWGTVQRIRIPVLKDAGVDR